MEGFSYATPADVTPLVKGSVVGAREQMLESALIAISARLSGRFPGLRGMWVRQKKEVEDAIASGDVDAYSDLVDLVKAMVVDAARDFINNPDRMSSETIGVFAYSRLETEEKDIFSPGDLAALKALMEEVQKEQVGIIKTKMGMNAFPAAPMPTPYSYSNTRTGRSWSR